MIASFLRGISNDPTGCCDVHRPDGVSAPLRLTRYDQRQEDPTRKGEVLEPQDKLAQQGQREGLPRVAGSSG